MPATPVIVGDRHHDIDGGRLNGIASIAVTWGYAEAGELDAAAPDLLSDTMAELATALGLGGGASGRS